MQIKLSKIKAHNRSKDLPNHVLNPTISKSLLNYGPSSRSLIGASNEAITNARESSENITRGYDRNITGKEGDDRNARFIIENLIYKLAILEQGEEESDSE